jgi:hypothetical protein
MAVDVNLVFLTVDAAVSARRKVRPQQGWRCAGFDDPLLDGPVSRRLAVVDIDPVSGLVAPGARFVPPKRSQKYATFDTNDRQAMMQVSVFTTVMRVIDLFESEEALGRRLTWAFPGEQLLIVPRAGEWANAFYDRDSRSLQFFYFTPDADTDKPVAARRVIYTALSPDIVSHEAGHAVLDAIAPDLYDAITPQALAMHEAIADLVAVFFTFEIGDLRNSVLKEAGGDLANAREFGWIAEEFGSELSQHGADQYLRSLFSEAHIDSSRKDKNFLASDEPHDLSVVLSAAIFQVLITEHRAIRAERAKETGKSEFSVSGYALYVAAEKVRRILFRALDYLPPGDASFADLGRAMIAADKASFPDAEDGRIRVNLAAELERRGIVPDADDLEPMPVLRRNPFDGCDMDALIASDWVAYQLVGANRDAFCVPADASFEVRPRLRVQKACGAGDKKTVIEELILKISWTDTEPFRNRRGLPTRRRLLRGTTVVIDLASGAIRLRLSNNPACLRGGETAEKALAQSRSRYLTGLLDQGLLTPVNPSDAPAVRRLGLIPAEETAGALRVKGLGRMLHLHRHAGPVREDPS